MNPSTHDHRVPDDLLDDEAGLAERYHAAGDEQPGAVVDNAILAAAHRAVQSRPHPASPFSRRWAVPASLAAVLVLSVGLVVSVYEEEGRPLLQDSLPPADLMSEPAPVQSKRVSRLPDGAIKEADDLKDEEREASGIWSGYEHKNEGFARPAPADSEVQPQRSFPSSAPAPARPANSPAVAPSMLRKRGVLQSTDSQEAQGRESSGSMFDAKQGRRAEETFSAPAAPLRSTAVPPGASPEAMLEDILSLGGAGQLEAARQRLAEFRKLYPDYRLLAWADRFKAVGLDVPEPINR